MKFIKIILLAGFLISFSNLTLNANIKALPEDRLMAKGLTEKECCQQMQKALQKKKWNDAIEYGNSLREYRSKTPSGVEALYFLGISYFEKGNLEKANELFTEYLTKDFMPKYFERTMEYKFQIAEKYHNGAGKQLFGLEKMPAWIPAEEDALKLYDEVINSLPQSKIAIKAFFNKAQLHFKFEEYKEAIEAAENLISKYSKHELAIESYLLISQSYLRQADPKHHENDLLNLAQLNLARFEKTFPLEERISDVKKDIAEIEEIYAQGLYDVAQFYSKKKQKAAVEIYYRKIKSDFPKSKIAQKIVRLENSKK